MNTRNKILTLLSRSKKPLGPKTIALELKKTGANIRKILSNLCKEGKIEKAGYGKYISSVNVKNRSVNFLNVSVNIDDIEAEKLIKEARNRYLEAWRAKNPGYLKKWRARNPDRVKNWLKAYRKKYPERIREYQRRYWLKKALSGN